MLIARSFEKLADTVNPLPPLFAAAVAEALYGFKNGFGVVADEVVVHVNHQDCGALTESRPLPVAGLCEYLFIPLGQDIVPNHHNPLPSLLNSLLRSCPLDSKWLHGVKI